MRVREITADLFITLDGFASATDQPPYFGYFGPELGKWIRRELDRPQAILMGRVTYQALSGIAGSPSAGDATSARLNELPKIVFSNTLREPLTWNARLLRGEFAEAMSALKQQPGDPIRSFGSITLVRGLMQLGLLDRLRLVVFPLVAGSAGREPIFAGHAVRSLQLIDTQMLDSRLVVLEYRPDASPPRGGSGRHAPASSG